MDRDPLAGERPGTFTEHALKTLRRAVLSGDLSPGSRIQIEDTAERMGMSTIPVREALRTLASEGLVVQLPQRGFRVPEVTLADLDDTYRLRRLLDPMAVRMAVPQIGADRASMLRTTFSELAESYEQSDWSITASAHRRFHFGIYEAADSPWLLRILSMLWGNSERYRHASVPRRGDPKSRAAAHGAILDACLAGDVELAARLMEAHVERTHQTVSELLEHPSEADAP